MQAELQYANKLVEFADKRTQVEENLATNKQNVDALSLADLNKNVCGAATEGCDDTCGGAGCDQCGGISCEGAVTISEEAMFRAEKTQEILENLTAEANELQLRIQVRSCFIGIGIRYPAIAQTSTRFHLIYEWGVL